MHHTLLQLAVQAALIAVRPAPEQACPTTAQVAEAISLRLPGALVPFHLSANPEVLVLGLSGAGAGGLPTVTLIDHLGKVRLARTFMVAQGSQQQDCQALADTIALVTERHLQRLDLRPVPSVTVSPPDSIAISATQERWRRSPWDVFLGTGWHLGRPVGGLGSYELSIGMARAIGSQRRMFLDAAVSMAGEAPFDWRAGSGALRRGAAEVGLAGRVGVGPGDLEAGLFLRAEAMQLRARADAATQLVVRVAPIPGARAAYRIPIGQVAFVRLIGAIGIALLRYEFVDSMAGDNVAFATQRVHARVGLEGGISF